MKDAAGATSTVAGVFSNTDPKGIPDRGRTLDFYRFYLFRLETAAMFIEACVTNTPWEHMPIMPGNGDVGPEQMNHNGYWPPAFTRRGMITTTWTYNCPASAKMHAETIRIAEEFGGDSIITVPLFVYATNTPRNALTITSAGISALNNGVLAWGFTCTLKGPDQPAWMKTVFLGSRLTHATTGLTHAPPLYVWLPESIVYNDLVDLKPDEGENWKKVWQALFDANLDYAVTSLLKISRRAVLLYACVRPVLTAEEFGRLKNFIEAGGTVLVTFTRKPEYPDGTPIADWDSLPPQRVISMELSAAALAQKAGGLVTRPNWPEIRKHYESLWLNRDNGMVIAQIQNLNPNRPAPEPWMLEAADEKHLDPEKFYKLACWRRTGWNWHADLFQYLLPSYGPNVFVGFCGGKPVFGVDTVWHDPVISSLDEADQIHFDQDNYYCVRIDTWLGDIP